MVHFELTKYDWVQPKDLMTEKTIQVQNISGIHARPAARFVKLASQFQCQIKLIKDNLEVDGKSILGIMSLAAEKGSKLTIKADGEKELEAVEQLINLLKNIFKDEENSQI